MNWKITRVNPHLIINNYKHDIMNGSYSDKSYINVENDIRKRE